MSERIAECSCRHDSRLTLVVLGMVLSASRLRCEQRFQFQNRTVSGAAWQVCVGKAWSSSQSDLS